MLRPSGDQSDWASSSGLSVSCRRSLPSSFMVKMSPVLNVGSARKLENAMRPLKLSACAAPGTTRMSPAASAAKWRQVMATPQGLKDVMPATLVPGPPSHIGHSPDLRSPERPISSAAQRLADDPQRLGLQGEAGLDLVGDVVPVDLHRHGPPVDGAHADLVDALERVHPPVVLDLRPL